MKNNLVYFQSNYFLLFLVLCIYSALMEPIFLIGIAIITFIWIYNLKYRNTPFIIRDKEIPERFVSIILLIVSLLILYITSPNWGSVVQWLFVATTALVFLHSLLYTPRPVDEFGFGLPSESSAPFSNV